MFTVLKFSPFFNIESKLFTLDLLVKAVFENSFCTWLTSCTLHNTLQFQTKYLDKIGKMAKKDIFLNFELPVTDILIWDDLCIWAFLFQGLDL